MNHLISKVFLFWIMHPTRYSMFLNTYKYIYLFRITIESKNSVPLKPLTNGIISEQNTNAYNEDTKSIPSTKKKTSPQCAKISLKSAISARLSPKSSTFLEIEQFSYKGVLE